MLDKLLEENEFLAVFFCKYISKLTGLAIMKWGTKMFCYTFIGLIFLLHFSRVQNSMFFMKTGLRQKTVESKLLSWPHKLKGAQSVYMLILRGETHLTTDICCGILYFVWSNSLMICAWEKATKYTNIMDLSPFSHISMKNLFVITIILSQNFFRSVLWLTHIFTNCNFLVCFQGKVAKIHLWSSPFFSVCLSLLNSSQNSVKGFHEI